jgi:hypothetical protein
MYMNIKTNKTPQKYKYKNKNIKQQKYKTTKI